MRPDTLRARVYTWLMTHPNSTIDQIGDGCEMTRKQVLTSLMGLTDTARVVRKSGIDGSTGTHYYSAIEERVA